MATETIQAPAQAMPAVATGGGARGGSSSSVRAGAGMGMGMLPPPRRGQIKEKIVKDVIAAVAAMAAGLVKNSRGDGGAVGLPASDDK